MERFSDLIKNRRSMRKFTEQELTQEEVVALLKAALMAPSSKRSNPWQFIVVDDRDTLKKLSLCKEVGRTDHALWRVLPDADLQQAAHARLLHHTFLYRGCFV